MNGGSDNALQRFAENLPGAAFYFAIDPSGHQSIQFLNSGCTEIWAIDETEIEADPSRLWNMVHPDDLEAMHASVAASAQDLSIWETGFRITNAAGVQKHILGRGTPTRTSDGGVKWLTFLFDVTAQKRTEHLFEVVAHQLQYISSSIPDGFALFDQNEQLVVCNSKFRDAYGLDATRAAKGTTYRSILECAARRQIIPGAIGREKQWVDAALENFRSAKSIREEEWSGSRWMKILDRPTEDGGRVTFRIETTESVRRKNELEAAASTDTLTGALNRRGLGAFLAAIKSQLNVGERVALMHIDLDKFKAINDGFGHDAGDFLLVKIAKKLHDCVPAGAKVARVGGDEFVVAMTSSQSDTEIIELAEALRNAILEPVVHHGTTAKPSVCRVGATVGIATWAPDAAESVDQILMDADTALLAGKSMGRNQTVLFRDEMRRAAIDSANIAAQIKDGIPNGAFEPFFQPQITFPGARLTGLEALARWKRPDGSYLSAASFIEVANETGLIADIDLSIVRGSLDALKTLAETTDDPISMSINLSGLHLSRETLVEGLLDELFLRNLTPDMVNIEILESILLDDRTDNIGKNIIALADAGFRIELDDFGTGHSALASLTRFPVDVIKVDRSLINEIHRDPKKQAITEGIFSVCEKLGIDAIAEGVETNAELNTLRKIGFSRFQGYCFARPMPAKDLFAWAEQWGNMPAIQRG